VWWCCSQGEDHEWQTSIVHRIRFPKCPFCNGKKVSSENSLKTRFPEIAKEWHTSKNTISPSEVTKCSGKKVWWQCDKGHEWKATVNDRAGTKKRKCPYCQGRTASIEDNLSTQYPHLVKEWHESKNSSLLPSDFRPKSNTKVWWRCSQNNEHEWKTMITSRTDGQGCPFCAGKRTSSSYSLAVVNPTLAKK
jgi:predicted methyltransferase